MPHVEFWSNVGALVKDGFMWSKAKYNKEEYTAIPAPTVVHIDDDLAEKELRDSYESFTAYDDSRSREFKLSGPARAFISTSFCLLASGD
jgi:hypothetical protein